MFAFCQMWPCELQQSVSSSVSSSKGCCTTINISRFDLGNIGTCPEHFHLWADMFLSCICCIYEATLETVKTCESTRVKQKKPAIADSTRQQFSSLHLSFYFRISTIWETADRNTPHKLTHTDIVCILLKVLQELYISSKNNVKMLLCTTLYLS